MRRRLLGKRVRQRRGGGNYFQETRAQGGGAGPSGGGRGPEGIAFFPSLFPLLPPPSPPRLFWIKLWRRKELEVNASAQFSCEEEAEAAAVRSRGGGGGR